MDVVEKIMRKIEESGNFIYYNGNTVVDRIKGRELRFITMVTKCELTKVEDILDEFASEIDYNDNSAMNSNNPSIYIKLLDGRSILMTKIDSLESYLQKCSLTIDALFETQSGMIVKYDESGQFCVADARSKTLNGEIDSLYMDIDIFNILRGILYSVIYDLQIGIHLKSNMEELCSEDITNNLKSVRIMMDKIMGGRHCIRCLKIMAKYNILQHIFPSIERTVGFDINSSKHHRTLFDHLLTTVNHVPQSNLEIRYAALLHDIAKPSIRINLKDRTIYPDHPTESAIMTEEILRRLGYSEIFIKKVYLLIYYHSSRYQHEMKELNLPEMIRTFQSCSGDNSLLNEIIDLQVADVVSTKPPYKLDIIFNLKNDINNFLNKEGDKKNERNRHHHRHSYRNKDTSFRCKQNNRKSK